MVIFVMFRFFIQLLGLACLLSFAVGSAGAAGASLEPCSGWLSRKGVCPPYAKKLSIRVLLAGDSLMESLGPQMVSALAAYANITFMPIGKQSTGLSRSDYYNWPDVLRGHLSSFKPQVVVMWVGTNDAQGIYGKSGLGAVGSEAWQAAYREKVRELLLLVLRTKARMILMGPPVVGEPMEDKQLALINRLMADECRKLRKYGATFVDTRAILSDSAGRFRATGRVPLSGAMATLRTADKVHITADGNNLVMDCMLPYLGREIARYFRSMKPTQSSIRIQPGRRN